MKNNRLRYLTKILLIASYYLLVTLPLVVSAAQVTLQWNANDPAPEGYRLYQRLDGGSFNYNASVWTGTGTTCVIDNLSEGTTYYYVVRAFQGNDESGDSNEVEYTPSAPAPEPDSDRDGDGVYDDTDAFPDNNAEWLDTDSDGIGDNADTDDDGDGMPDSWESAYGLNPVVADAQQDLDGDGISNLDEYTLGSDPGNSAPAKPMLSEPADGALAVSLTPTLVTHGYVDSENDEHISTTYQISTTPDISSLVYEKNSEQHLTRLRIMELILDPESTYYWRVRFFDSQGGSSEWSDWFSFITIDYQAAGDLNGDGILDNQEMESWVDLDADGNADSTQAGLQGVNTPDSFNPQVAVKCTEGDAEVVGIRALDIAELPSASNRPENLTGVISFKLYLADDATTTATVVIFFSQPAPANAHWYKYDPDEGWTIYPRAVFSADRMSLILELEDGGAGDQDGVQNGIIVDPSGLGYSSQTSNPSGFEPMDASASGCFIATPLNEIGDSSISAAMMPWLLAVCVLFGISRNFWLRLLNSAKKE